MKKEKTKVLLIEDNLGDTLLIREMLTEAGRGSFILETARSFSEGLMKIAAEEPELVLLDLNLPDSSGLETLRKARHTIPDIPIVILTGIKDEEMALEAVKQGAQDYLVKGEIDDKLLARSIRYALARKELELELEKERDRAQKYLDIAEVIFLALDSEERITMINKKGCEILGCSEGEILGRNWFELFCPREKREKRRENFRKTVSGALELSPYVELDIITCTGERKLIAWHNTLILDDRGQITGILSSGDDITEKKRVENSIKSSAMEWRKTFDSISDMILILDPQLNIIRVNKAVSEMLKLPYQEILGKRCYHMFHNTNQPPDFCPYKELVAERKEICWEQFEPKFERHFSITMTPVFDESGNLNSIIGIYRDITEEKRLQEQLEHAVKMEAVGRLAGGMAHDFNNNLTPIVGICDLLLEEMNSEHPLYSDIVDIRESAERCTNLVKQLMAFSRKQVVEPKTFNLNNVINNMEKMLARLIGEHIHLEKNLDTRLELVKADIGQIELVIVNLVVNARDAMPYGGRISIETANVYIDEEFTRSHLDFKPGWYVVLCISDTGIGMDKDILDKIFEPFFTTKEKGKGTGLGLAIVYGIVKQAGGSILVESEPGRGTTFRIYLPVVDESEKKILTKESKPKTMALHGWETILLVEDELSVRKVVKRALEYMGYKVIDAEDGQQALTLIKQLKTPIDLLITDVIMPEMSGKDLALRIQALFPDLKVVFISGYLDDIIGNQGILEPGIQFIQKPIKIEALAQKIRETLDSISSPGSIHGKSHLLT